MVLHSFILKRGGEQRQISPVSTNAGCQPAQLSHCGPNACSERRELIRRTMGRGVLDIDQIWLLLRAPPMPKHDRQGACPLSDRPPVIIDLCYRYCGRCCGAQKHRPARTRPEPRIALQRDRVFSWHFSLFEMARFKSHFVRSFLVPTNIKIGHSRFLCVSAALQVVSACTSMSRLS